MDGHYNLYKLFLEDKRKNPMPEQKVMNIRKNLEKFFKTLKPPEISQPLIITTGEEPQKKLRRKQK